MRHSHVVILIRSTHMADRLFHDSMIKLVFRQKKTVFHSFYSDKRPETLILEVKMKYR